VIEALRDVRRRRTIARDQVPTSSALSSSSHARSRLITGQTMS
jgi:hypothetical protein